MIQEEKKRQERANEKLSIDKPSVERKPRFVRCDITGPDGKTRPGWEMWLGEHCFGRSDQKEVLMRSLERQQQPPQSFHWREVHRQRFDRNRQPQARLKQVTDKSKASLGQV